MATQDRQRSVAREEGRKVSPGSAPFSPRPLETFSRLQVWERPLRFPQGPEEGKHMARSGARPRQEPLPALEARAPGWALDWTPCGQRLGTFQKKQMQTEGFEGFPMA